MENQTHHIAPHEGQTSASQGIKKLGRDQLSRRKRVARRSRAYTRCFRTRIEGTSGDWFFLRHLRLNAAA